MPRPERYRPSPRGIEIPHTNRVEERSAGALVFNRDGGVRSYLILRYPAGHWDFPKGNIEKGETPVQTMLREVREETGLVSVEPVQGFERVIEYFYRRDDKRIHKQVVFFLAESRERKVTLSYEHEGYTWAPFERALKVVTYPNSKKLLQAAEERLRRARGSGSGSEGRA